MEKLLVAVAALLACLWAPVARGVAGVEKVVIGPPLVAVPRPVPGPGCESVQNAGIADCILETMVSRDFNSDLINGNGSTVLHDRMGHMTRVAMCLQGRADHLTTGRGKRAVDDAEPKVQRNLKLVLCYNDCQMQYGQMASSPATCEVVDYLHLTACALQCLKTQSVMITYAPNRMSRSPLAYSPVNEDDFAVIKNDYSIAYVRCIVDNMRPGPVCNAYDYLDMSYCQITSLLDSKINSLLSGPARKKRALTDGVMYDRILNSACAMKCLAKPKFGDRCFMESLMFYNLCLNKCVRATISTHERLGIWDSLFS